MSDDRPLVRARATQDLLTAMDGFRPGLEAHVRQRVDDAVLQTVDQAMATDWVPMDVTRHVVQAAVDILGPDDAPRLWTYFFTQHYVRSPLLRYFIDGVLRVVGASPVGLIRRAPKAWPSTYRNFANVHVELRDEENSAAVILSDVHAEVFSYPAYFVALEGAFAGFLEVTGKSGTCTRTVDEAMATARFELRWS